MGVGSGVEVVWLGEVLGVLVSDVPEHEAINKDAATSTVGWNQRPAVRWKILDAPIGDESGICPGERPRLLVKRNTTDPSGQLRRWVVYQFPVQVI